MSSPAIDTTSDTKAFWTPHAGRLMREHPRQSWLIPLLALPLSHVALSPACTDEILPWCCPNRVHAAMRRDAARIADLAAAVSASNAGRGLSDEEAFLLLQFSHDFLGLPYTILMPPAFLMVGMDVPTGLPVQPLMRHVSEWVGAGALPVPMATFIACRALPMTRHPLKFLPKVDGYYAQLTRAIDARLQDQGATTWEDALALSHRFWSGTGWRDLGVWQANTFHLVETRDTYKSDREREQEEHDRQRRLHRAERKRLQEETARLKEELRRLRPFRDKVDGLRVDAERVHHREVELTQARDRALARVQALEADNADLERAITEATARLSAVATVLAELGDEPEPAPESESEPLPEPERPTGPQLVRDELPATLLAGRTVFFFTGELRRSSAEAVANSLSALGPREIRTFCLRQGSDGPDAYPPDALVIVDYRFAGHKQSGIIADRAERSGAQY